jgi:ATP-dependent Clp protease ATP-binding subunit ClpB
VLGDGRLTDAIGRVVSFRDAIIIMTTNIGQDHFLREDTFDKAKEEAMKELAARYRGEFLNRFNGRQNIYCFEKLDLSSIEKIVVREIAKLNAAYKESDIAITLPDSDLNVFCHDQYDPTTGARGLPGYIQANIEPFIVNALLQQGSFAGVVNLSYDREAKKFDVSLDKKVDA